MTASYSPTQILPNAFPGIGKAEVDELIASSHIADYPTGTVLCRENMQENIFYILLEGNVSVTKSINRTEARVLKALHAGDFFGELALIQNAPRAATVTASTPVKVMEIHKDAFDDVLHRSGSVSLAMVHEISRRLRENDALAVEDLRLRANELARAYQKLAEQEIARREFVTNIAHELRTPLMAASGYLQLLQRGIIPTEQLPNTIDTVARNIQQITSLVNDILFLQEMDLILPNFQPVDVAALIKSIVERYQPKAETAKVAIRTDLPHNLPPVSGDAKTLERALVAIMDNAIKFSAENHPVDLRVWQEGIQLIIEIEDYGIGIEPEHQRRLFDRFSHVEKSGEKLFSGIGLGLAITKQVIEQHHGKLEVTSEVGKGTKFTVKLNILRVMV